VNRAPIDFQLIGTVLASIGVGLLLFALPLFKIARRRRRIGRMTDGEIAAAWLEIVDRLSDLGAPVDPTKTPLEIARAESHELVPLATLYTAAAYGGRDRAPCVEEFERAERALRRKYEGRRWNSSFVRLSSLRR
jgi:Asp-tRNA(Asn)/Glu-tRNA(Gln) amidotransferase A subunit family amidase